MGDHWFLDAMTVGFDDDFEVLRRAKRYRPRLIAVFVALDIAVGLFIALSLLRNPGLLLLLPLLSVWPWLVYESIKDVAWAKDVTESYATLEITNEALTIRHPALPSTLEIGLDRLRTFDVVDCDDEPSVNGSYELFPLERVGPLHAFDEPRSLLFRYQPGLGKFEVRLTGIDFGSRFPNVAIMFNEPEVFDVFTPGADMWAPPVPLLSYVKGPGQWTANLRRLRQRVKSTGLYLRVFDAHKVADSLMRGGVRRGFRCDDWVTATGLPHP